MSAGPPETFSAGERAVLEAIATGAPLGEVLERIVRLVEHQAAGMLCSILLLDQAQRRVRHGAAPSLPAEFVRAIDGAPIGPAAGSCGTAAYLGEPVVVEDIATDPLWLSYRDLALPHGLRACWSSPILSPDGRVLGTFAMYYHVARGPSVSERRWVDAATHLGAIAIGRHLTEEALRRSETRYRRIADTAREGIWLVDAEGRTLFANDRVAEMLGCEGVDLTGRSLFEFVDEAAWPDLRSDLARTAGDAGAQRDVRFRRADGAELWTIVSVSPVTDDAGTAVGMLAMVTDITERKAAETRIRQLARLYAVSSSVNEAISRIREPGALYAHACRIAVEQGLMRLAWVGIYNEVGDRLVPVARHGADDGYVDRITVGVRDETGGGPVGHAFRGGAPVVANDIASDPGFYWKAEALARGLRSCAAFPITIKGRPAGVLAIYADQAGYFSDEEVRVLTALADDISFGVESAANEAERRQAEAELQRSLRELADLSQRLSFHVSRMPLGYIVWTHDLQVTEWNPAAERIFGWSAAEAIGRHAFELMVPSEAQPLVERVVVELLAGASSAMHFVGQGVRKDGRSVVCEWFNAPLRDAGGQVTGYLSMAHDVTERQQAEAERARLETELRQAQRIQSLGTLAGGIAHDFANVLAAILGNAENASYALPADHRVQRHLAHIKQAGERAGDLIRRILTFSRRQEPQRSLVLLQSVVEEALGLLRATLPPAVEIDAHLDAEAPGILADPTQIYQIVMNLGTNAAHAMGKGGGRLELRVETLTIDAATPSVPPDLREGRYLRLSVRDAGCGMDPGTVERIFEPFFTTKPVGEGTGLGLSVVHGIVKSHDGAITVDSAPAAGTTFRIYFPVAGPEAVAAVTRPEPPDVRGHGEHVLYVDDEEALVYMTTRILERLGYRVTGFTDSRQALEAFRARADDFDAVVTDLSMPRLPGLALAREIRRLRADVPVVFTSGYVRSEDLPALLELAPSQLLLKPNTVRDLGPTLHRLLASPPRSTRV